MATLETGGERSSVAEPDDVRRIFGPLDDTKVLGCPSSEYLRQRAARIKGGSGWSSLMILRGLLLVLQAT